MCADVTEALNEDRHLRYGYDANGSLTTKDTDRADGTSQSVVNTYNLQGRLETVTTTEYDDVPSIISTSVVAYKYNPQGIRVEKNVDATVTTYLVDQYNHTGYAQVLEETTGGATTTYTIGDDVISQTIGGATEYLLYDGHGEMLQDGTTPGVTP